MNMTDFMEFWPCVVSGPHAAGHGWIGAGVSICLITTHPACRG
jgi:hypothetical protein